MKAISGSHLLLLWVPKNSWPKKNWQGLQKINKATYNLQQTYHVCLYKNECNALFLVCEGKVFYLFIA